MNRLRFILIASLYFLAGIMDAKVVISGHVFNENNEPLDVATTKLLNGDGKLLQFSITDEEGYFEYTLDDGGENLILIIECLGYDTYNRPLTTPDNLQDMSIRLTPKAMTLKEVVVGAPSVAMRGDTISYRLSAFAGKGDVTLKDAMRNLPGIDVSENGKIKYLGKDISNFYIEGMDLLGGKYNIATDNLPVSSVSNVEILNNHQSVKLDKEIFSDNVAINIKLSSKAKFRPVGTYEAKAGYGDDWLYLLSGAGMMFKKNFQTILTAKYGNIYEFAEKANTDHNVSGESLYSASQLLGDLGLSTPPLERNRFIHPSDFLVTLNEVNKMGEDATLRANAGYSYSKASYDYLSFRDYYDADDPIHINQEYLSESRIHRPTLNLEYKLNSDKQYLTNTLSGNAGINDLSLLSFLDDDKYRQREKLRDFVIRDDFRLTWRRSKFRWNLMSAVEYGATPKGLIEVEESERGSSFIQNADSRRFLTKHTLSSAYEYRQSRIWIPFTVQYYNNALNSSLAYSEAENHALVNNVQLWFAPQYEYTHPRRKYVVRASANFKWEYNHIKNSGTQPINATDSRLSISPYLYFNWMITPSSTFRAQATYSEQLGDIADFLTAPVRTDNLDISYRSGIWSLRKSVNAMLHYDFKLPMEMWYLNVDMIYDKTRSNIISNSNITDSSIVTSTLLYPNNMDNLTGMMNITKILSTINTKVSFGGSYMLARGAVSQNEIVSRYDNTAYSVFAKLIAKPWPFIELDYDGNIGMSHNRFRGIKSSLSSQLHKIELNVFPFKGFQIKAGSDILRKELTEGVSKTFGLVDLGVAYKFSYYRIGLDLNNILNTKQYSYSIFSGINQFSYNYTLRSRELILSFSFTR